MKTDRYKTSYLNRLSNRGAVDGFAQGSMRRSNYTAATGSRRTSQKSTNMPVTTDGAVNVQAAPHPEVTQVIESVDQQDALFTNHPGHFSLPSYEPPARLKLVVGKRKKMRRTIARISAVFAALIIVGSSLFVWRGYTTASKVLSGSTTVPVLSSEKVDPTLLKGEGDGRVNVLLLGIGGPNHDGGDLTDTMILASIDPVNHGVVLLSIPRDLWVKMPAGFFGSSQKINAAYSAGKYQYLGKADLKSTNPEAIQAGLANLDTVIGDVLGINVDYHVLVNFEAFEQAIDTVDGVTVDVKQSLVDASMAWENNNNPVLATAGVQQMDGKEALLYARSRHSTSDFDRSERQRQLIVALKQKILTLGTFSNPVKLDGLASAFGKNVYSDFSTKAVLRLYDITKQIDNSQIQSLDLVTAPHSLVTTDRVGNISVVRPKLGFDTYSDIQTFVHSELRDGYIVKENAKVLIAADTAAHANTVQLTLQRLGYNCQNTTIFSGTTDKTVIVDLTKNKAPYTRNYLEKRYGTTATTTLPAGMVVPDGTQFVILVGK